MNRAYAVLVATFVVVVFALTGAAEGQEAGSSKSASVGVVNINTATAEQLAYLPGVGKVIAARIVAYRVEQGPFKQASDLMQVSGIKAKTYERMAPWVVVSGKTTAAGKIKAATEVK